MIDISKCKNEQEIKEAHKYEALNFEFELTKYRLEKTIEAIYELNVQRIKLKSERDTLQKKLQQFENKDYVVNDEYYKQKHTE